MNLVRYILLIPLAGALLACAKDRADKPPPETYAEVEILIGGPGSRADKDPGTTDERFIEELDLLIFVEGKYAYRRQAYKLDDYNRFRATLLESAEPVTCHFVANCREILDTWEGSADHTGLEWPAVQSMLTDSEPWRLAGGEEPLPMWAVTTGTVSSVQINRWGPVELLRAVASVDLFVERNADTGLFKLTDLYLWYAPDRGYLAQVPDPLDPDDESKFTNASPPLMATSLTTEIHSDDVEDITIVRDNTPYRCDAIAYKIYIYDNDVTAATVTATRKFSRAILGGYYDQTGDPAEWKKSWYPLDFVNDDGTFRQLIRNWKYEFIVDAVYGPGYVTPGEAADNYPIDINVQLKEWDRDGVDIGSAGKYYVSLDRRYVPLARYAGSKGVVNIKYRIYDDVPGESFTLSFLDDSNGAGQGITNGIRNDRFSAVILHDADGKSAVLRVEALQAYDTQYNTDTVVIKFRDLRFEIAVRQYDANAGDWNFGGDQEEGLG